jgi:hypothetical protein
MAGAKGKYAEVSPLILECIAQGMNNREACAKVGLSESEFYLWLNTKSEFSEAYKEAKKQGDLVGINSVEAALLEVARGFDYEEVRTEYESKLNPDTQKYEPTIKKQVRVKKHVVPSTEAIKFYLSNKAPEEWKNRIEQNNTGNLATDLRLVHVTQEGGRKKFPSSEAEVDTER